MASTGDTGLRNDSASFGETQRAGLFCAQGLMAEATCQPDSVACADRANGRAELASRLHSTSPSVAVVIPTYDNADTLPRALASALAQSVQPAEIIIVDDCSSNSLDAAALRALDARITVVRHAQRSGGSAARNTGIDRASAAFIAFLDADDVWFHDKLERQLARVTLEDKVCVVASNCLLGDKSDARPHNSRPPAENESLAHYLLVGGAALQTSTLLVPTALARAVRFTTGLRRHQDLDFLLRLEAAGAKLIYEPDSLSIYDVSDRPSRISQQDMAFLATVEWFRVAQPPIPAHYMQHYFATNCVTRASLSHAVPFMRALIWVGTRSLGGMARLAFSVLALVAGKLFFGRRPDALIAAIIMALSPSRGAAKPSGVPPQHDRFDVDFSLAIHNRTGKYFIGRDLIENVPERIGRIYYWLLPLRAPPRGLFGRVIGRLLYLHVRAGTQGGPLAWLPRRRSRRPVLHLDPFTVRTVVLCARDIVLCHDVGPLTHPELFDADVCRAYAAIYAEIARVGPHIVFVSRASRDAFAQAYPAARPASMTIIYPAIRADVDRGAATRPAEIDAPFLLTVGSIGARKNQVRCIRAFSRSGLAARGVRYVLCGAQEPGYAAAAAAAAETPGVVLLPYVSDAALRWLYAHAAGFVLASLLEGFGVPVAEAIGHGLVPLVTRGSVLHEVAGDGALLVEALDEAEIARAMVRLIDMPPEERSDRQMKLRHAVERFALTDFVAAWRRLLGDVLAPG